MDVHEDFLPAVLMDQVKARRTRKPVDSAFDAALEAALEFDDDHRPWSLITLAAQLRSEGSLDAALRVLDAAVALDPAWEAKSAAFTVAAAIHCDRGDFDVARKICDQTMEAGVDEYIVSVALRVYWELARSTKLQEFYDRWKALSATLDTLKRAAASQ